MDIKQLRALLAIAETGSVSRAAEILHIVQPAVSRQLRLLEEDLGAALFARGRRGMELTESGQLLVEHARRALRELDQAKAEIAPTPGIVTGIVTIGLLPSTSDLLAAPLITALKQQYPKLTVRISMGYAGYLQKWLEDGEVDVALLYDPKPSSLLEVDPLLDETLYLVGLPDAGMNQSRPVPLHHLEGKPMILPSQPHGLRLLLDHACAVAGVNLTIVAETNAMSIQKNLVSNGLGFTVLPSVAIFEDVAQGRLCAAPVTAPDLQRKIVMALPVTRRSSVAVRCAVSELRTQIKALVNRNCWPGARWLAG
ncbi:MAG: LysR family transcriptional regulator, nitrogen assimilation regulatory protein [Burkholderiales bacterium]